MVRRIRPALVIEIVQQTGDAPRFLVLAEFAGVGAHAGFDGKHVPDEALVLHVFVQECERFRSIHGVNLAASFLFCLFTKSGKNRISMLFGLSAFF
jgi:hypothetical protein